MMIESLRGMTVVMLRICQSNRSCAAPAFGGGLLSHFSKSGFSMSTSPVRMAPSSVRRIIQLSTSGCHPRSLALTKMIPARETVAGEAFRKFSTSKTILQLSVMGMRSLLARVRILLSSSTVLRFSIQMASTGPSQMIHDVYFSERLFFCCQMEANTPGVHSSLMGSLNPYIWESVIAFGFILMILWGLLFPVIQSVRTVAISVLPHNVGPTSMKP
mmetsp:Transcript_29952/g.85603  ORF Transcript_29952/g.85603 Transcript_29952/m.85603 type:complete len:216 (+) Transcript_29952:1599-2246(+)